MFIIIVGYIIGLTAMQKGCYFTSRHDIVHWINHILGTSLSTIEQLGSGNVYCQLLDAAYPGKVPLQKVKWKAYLEVDFIHNFKILQNCFEHLGITKYIEVQRLVKAKYQDNLEFIQWMMAELNQKITDNHNYNPSERRNSDIHLISGGLKQSKSSSQLNLNNNKVLTPRGQPPTRKTSLTQLRPLTPRPLPLQNSVLPCNARKKGVGVTVKPKEKRQVFRRMKTQMCPLMFHDITKELILQEDEECF